MVEIECGGSLNLTPPRGGEKQSPGWAPLTRVPPCLSISVTLMSLGKLTEIAGRAERVVAWVVLTRVPPCLSITVNLMSLGKLTEIAGRGEAGERVMSAGQRE